MPVRITQWQRRVTGIESGHSLAKRKIVQALGVGVVGKDGQSVRHALFPRQLQRMVVRIYVSDIRLHGRERVSFEFAATGRVHEEVGCARVRFSGRGAASAGVVILRFQDVKASRSDVRGAHQNARGQLTLDGQVPLVNRWHVIRAARVVVGVAAVAGPRLHDRPVDELAGLRPRERHGRRAARG